MAEEKKKKKGFLSKLGFKSKEDKLAIEVAEKAAKQKLVDEQMAARMAAINAAALKSAREQDEAARGKGETDEAEKARIEAEEKRQAEIQAAKDVERAKQLAEERKRREAEAKAEAEEKVKFEAEAKVRAEARAKAEAEAKAKREAEAKARAEEEARIRAEEEVALEKARKEAEEREAAALKAKQDAEAAKRVKAEAEAQAKRETEAKARAAEEARIRAEEEAALEKARREAGEREAAELKARQDAEAAARAKAQAEAQAKLEAEAKARAEQEARIRAEEEAALEKARIEAGKRQAAELKAEQEAEAAARAKAEAEALAKQERLAAEARALAEKQEAERLEAQNKAREEAKAKRLAEEAAEAERRAEEAAKRAEAEAVRREQDAIQAAERAALAPPEPEPDTLAEDGFFNRINKGLKKSTSRMSESMSSMFNKRKLDNEALEELEDLLITSDLGVGPAMKVTELLAKDKFDKQITDMEIKIALADVISDILTPLEKPLILTDTKPQILLFVGVNGSGKTTTLGKIAKRYTDQGKKVLLAAGDTFRAAAVQQLTIWGERSGAPVVSGKLGADAAGLVYDAIDRAKKENYDILMIDTAGRLQNRTELMDELSKIVRVIKKADDTAPHHCILVLDATVGQNALSQTEAFRDTAGVTGLIMTKLDGTAKGGVLVALSDKFKLPIHSIGIGERIEDLENFSAPVFAAALSGVADAVMGDE